MTTDLENSLGDDAPPELLSRSQKALWWLAKGGLKTGKEWEKAHNLCQSGEGMRDHDLVHALAHWIEGDLRNRDYWYRRAADAAHADTIPSEWRRLADMFSHGGEHG